MASSWCDAGWDGEGGTVAEPLTLVIETDAGTAIRRIPDASPLPDGETQGHAAEDAIRDAAAT